MSKPILCLDFDGVVHHYTSKWTEAHEVNDGPTPGAAEALRLYAEHFTIMIFSSRSHQFGGRTAMAEWCEKHFGHEFTHTHLEFPHVKPPALVSLDDRGLTFRGIWPTVEELKAFRPWNKLSGTNRNITGTVTLSISEYDHLIQRDLRLKALEAAGVDCWDGYQVALASLAS